MGLGAYVKLLAAGAACRLTGAQRPCRVLADAVANGPESEAGAAAILLVKAGDHGVEAVADAIERGAGDADLVDVLASIRTPRARTYLEALSAGAQGEITAAARSALTTLDELRAREDGEPSA